MICDNCAHRDEKRCIEKQKYEMQNKQFCDRYIFKEWVIGNYRTEKK